MSIAHLMSENRLTESAGIEWPTSSGWVVNVKADAGV